MTIGVRDAKLIFEHDAEYTLTVPLDPIKNVPDVKVNQGITEYESFSAHVESESNTMQHEDYCRAYNILHVAWCSIHSLRVLKNFRTE